LDRIEGKEETTEQKEEPKRKAGPPCNGMQFARMAIADLEQITNQDTERKEAFEYVKGWIKNHENKVTKDS
jgi:hypothetical protein